MRESDKFCIITIYLLLTFKRSPKATRGRLRHALFCLAIGKARHNLIRKRHGESPTLCVLFLLTLGKDYDTMKPWNESEHPRDPNGKFTDKGGDGGYRERVNAQIKWAKDNGVDLPLHSDGTLDTIRLEEIYTTSLFEKHSTKDEYIRFSDAKSAEDFFLYDDEKRGLLAKKNSTHGRWEKSLSSHQRSVLNAYTSDGYSDINSFLRGYNNGNAYSEDYVKSQIKALDAVIASYELKSPIVTYRSINSAAFSDHLDNIKSLIGTEYSDKAFMSSSPTLDSPALNKDLLMTIKLPAEKGIGAYIDQYNGLGEKEFLIARGKRFQITNAYERDKKYYIEMEMLL